MKIIYLILILTIYINAYGQTGRSAHNKKGRITTTKNNTGKTIYNQNYNKDTIVKPRETVTERYLKGDRGTKADTSTGKRGGNTSTFVGGVHVAPNAGEKFDSANSNININNENQENTTVTPVAAPNDTIFNVNTITDNSVNTNSGAVDRSGQAQFGQTNWGNNRSTVGESQWTIPPPITASFTNEFPAAAGTTWSRNNTDTSIYSAKYKSGDLWITTNYNASGQRMDMRTEVPLTLLPQRVRGYVDKLPNNLQVSTISKWQVLGKPDVYEIQTRTGKTIYVNNEGREVSR